MTRTSIRLALVGIALLVVASTLPLSVGTATAAQHSFVVEQGNRCFEVTPLNGNEDVISFYDYRNIENENGPTRFTYSSYMPQHLQQEDLSRLFLYDGPNGVSLVIIHNQVGGDEGDGSAATFQFDGLPSSGSWVVQDDDYLGQDDRWSRNRIDWMWYGDRADGGVFRDVDRGGTEITIFPAFDENAALYDDFDRTGNTRAWQFLTGDLASPSAVALDMSQPVTIRTGHCGPDETPPDATLSAGSGVVGQSVTFDARGSSDNRGVAAYRWDFDGDGEVDRETTDPTVSHAYDAPGTYEATVTVIDEGENADAASASVAVEPDDPPSATFEVGDSPTVGFPVTFDARAASDDVSIAAYRWDFDGDGEVERETTDPVVARTYEEAGSYEVNLTVVDSGGNTAAVNRTVAVDVDDPPDPTFRVESSGVRDGQSAVAVTGREVVFDATNATDDTGIAEYRWSFGDGTNVTGERVSYTYAGNGTYSVTLEVVDEGGNNATATTEMEVLPPDETAPDAAADASPATVEAGANVTFDANRSSDNRYLTGYHWDFGDGTSGSERQATHAYDSAGTYNATVVVTDGGGNTDPANVTVEVLPARPPNVSASIPDTVVVGETFAVEGVATDARSGVASYHWDFAGTTETGQQTSYAFEEAGTYVVTFTATDGAGHANATTQQVEVLPPDETAPTARLAAGANETREGEQVTFDASNATDDRRIAVYRWDFDGDDETDRTTENATVGHAYGDSGTYNATVTVVDGGNNTDNATVQIVVEAKRQAHRGGSGGSGGNGVSGGSSSVGPPPVNTDVERTGPNAAAIDVRNGRSDETIRADLLESDVVGETGVEFRSVAVDLAADDPHFVVETARPADGSLPGDVTSGSSPADVTLGSLAVEGTYINARQVGGVTYEVEVQHSRLADAGVSPADLTAYQRTGGAWNEVNTTVEERDGSVVLRVQTDALAPIIVGAENSVALVDAELAGEEVAADESVAVTATLRNEGDESRTLSANLTVDGEVAATKTVDVPPGETTEVTFEHALDPGTYEVGFDAHDVAIDGEQVGTVTVAEPVAVVGVADVSLNESTVTAGEQVAITATVENTGTKTGEETVTLTLFGERVATKTVTVSADETTEVTFVRQVEAAGTYTAKVGNQTAALKVEDGGKADEDGSNASGVPVPGFGVGVALLGLLTAVLLVRLRERAS